MKPRGWEPLDVAGPWTPTTTPPNLPVIRIRPESTYRKLPQISTADRTHRKLCRGPHPPPAHCFHRYKKTKTRLTLSLSPFLDFGFYQKQNRSGIILSARVIRPEAALHTYVVAQHNMETFTQERQF